MSVRRAPPSQLASIAETGGHDAANHGEILNESEEVAHRRAVGRHLAPKRRWPNPSP